MSAALGTRRLRVLVVDDEPGLCKMLSFELTHLGHEAMTAANADEAMHLLRTETFDLIITDVRMPGAMDGIDLVEAYWRENPAQKVIFVTGYALEEKLNQALLNPLSICLKKPFDLGELSQAIHGFFP